jgi:monovalent cation/hydrogen antiporter
VRMAWVYALASLPRSLRPLTGKTNEAPSWRNSTLVAWSGMRGGVALAAALATPLQTDAGAPFPERDLIIFLAFCVILATLVGQGLLFPTLIRLLRVEDDGLAADEELNARLEIAFAALDRIDELEGADWVPDDTVDRVRMQFNYRRRRFSSRLDGRGAHQDDPDDVDYEDRADTFRRFMAEVIGAERRTLRALRDDGTITDEVRRRVEYDLDLEEARLTPEVR